MDPSELTYAQQLLAWTVLWAAGGWATRQWLSTRGTPKRHDQ